MKRIFYLTACLTLSALPAQAGHATIRETDTAIIVEYIGDDEDIKAAAAQREEREKQEAAALQKEEELKQWKKDRAARREANRAAYDE